MAIRKANAVWQGKLVTGKGKVAVESKLFDGPYSFGTRFEEEKGTNPEELIGAAHAACYSMALSFMLEQAGFQPKQVATEAQVQLDKVADGFKITMIKLITKGDIPGMTKTEFLEFAEKAKIGCPVSQALAAVPIELDADLV